MDLVHVLPHVNAGLNATATVLLLIGYAAIKARRETAHKYAMLACFGVSVVFLGCYLTYHGLKQGISTPFPSYPPPAVRITYYGILISHIILAAVVPVLAVVSIVLGLRDRRAAHRRWSWVTLPIWLYVSVTGVLVYLMLYQLFPPGPPAAP